ncbi:hypothetical protein PCASD_07622 [Puccinia coronata f. sp. avenae]|uniref:Uncharacterized protein n=2 Tax=Puccinia coronata f. sp. avenae TaxID=200324 RepID=A0A2N5T921_9BASI|nr:hypothetical protein PCASD_12873 [Puccinia coronata f. sp. avenae]PLW39154.1 hypothetical protein PCASD_07622 [Puccinia coronata f. sp. avenae]
MRCLMVVIALLSLNPFQCLEKALPPTPVPTLAAEYSPFCDTRDLHDFQYMSLKDSRTMREDYFKANKRLILVVNDDGVIIKPSAKNDYQNRMDTVLSSLAADSKNEAWMVARLPVDLLESIYGHVKKLNLAGSNGRIFSEQNKAFVELPDGSLLEQEASQFIEVISTL